MRGDSSSLIYAHVFSAQSASRIPYFSSADRVLTCSNGGRVEKRSFWERNRSFLVRFLQKSIDSQKIEWRIFGLLISKLGDGRLLDMCVYWTKFGSPYQLIPAFHCSADIHVLLSTICKSNATIISAVVWLHKYHW